MQQDGSCKDEVRVQGLLVLQNHWLTVGSCLSFQDLAWNT